ncbi:MAG TPA: alanine--tRNA ligase [Verrucomicrobiae bacterium]|nr:alanine--tRNA ligase [Verrucomicrobiae bacterium]
MTSAQIRQSFLDFFKSKGHTIVPSASLMPDSPGLLFTNAGMNQFVPIFLNERAPDVDKWPGAIPGKPTRAADTQKCIRAGGKHNDLDDVGLDTYHHTFFEMLGNWSFGDYFKKEAIDWAWELVVETWKFPANRIYATVYSPDKSKGDPSDFDKEAAEYWAAKFTAAGLDPKIHIVNGNKKDNFWMMGETGPCGPCSELHVDLTPAGDTKGSLVNKGDARCIEIWNLVFIQFNANPDGTFSPLPAKHVDTGMGFERVTGIIQNTNGFKDFTKTVSNYETDIFRPIFDKLEKLSGKKYFSTLPGSAVVSTASGGVSPPESAARDARQGDRDGRATQENGGAGYYKRRLPHFERPWAKYMVTFSTRERRQLSPASRDVVLQSALHGHEHHRYELFAVCVMPDHVHILLEPQIKEQGKDGKPVFWPLSELLHSLKSFTAHEINKLEKTEGQVWENEFLDRIVRGQTDFEEKFHYICRNPWDSGIVSNTENYPWLWTPGSAVVSTASGGVSPPESAARDARQGDRDGRATQIQTDIAFRVIADHIRTLSFSIADGILPGNTDRNYVLRRILRRAVRYGRSLGFHEPFFYKLVDVVADSFGDVFPEVRAKKSHVQDVIRSEEEAFNKTLDRGIELFNEESRKSGVNSISGEFAFKLYDTYGFPLDLTELMAREQGLSVDTAGFEKLMDEQRARARAAQKKEIIAASNIDSSRPTRFVGFDHLTASATVQDVVKLKDKIAVTLDASPLYAEMGGQVGDTGELESNGTIWHIANTQKTGNTFLHFLGERISPPIAKFSLPKIPGFNDLHDKNLDFVPHPPEIGASAKLRVNVPRRAAIQRHHSVTHLLHWALHEIVSPDAVQKGSYVGPDKLTFDFSSSALTPAQVSDVEKLVNERIVENAPVSWTEVPYTNVKGRKEIMQFFGEKYGDTVRVVQIGGKPGNLDGYSMELCGGTHTRATGEVGQFRIVSEGAVAAGIRRIEAVAGLRAYDKTRQDAALLSSVSGRLNAPVAELEKKIEALLSQQKDLEKQLQSIRQKQAAEVARTLASKVQPNGATPRIIENLGAADGTFLQAVADALKGQFKGVIVLGGTAADAVSLVASVSPEFTASYQAGKIIQTIAPIVGGKGGGRPDNARGGGKDIGKLEEALQKASSMLSK